MLTAQSIIVVYELCVAADLKTGTVKELEKE